MRLFAALEISSAWKAHCADLQAELERVASGALRWVQPDLLHLTLAFLDEQPASALGAIQKALDRAARVTPAFRLELGQPDLFARDGRVAVVWVGVQDSSASLAPLRARVAEALRAADVRFDARRFAPHVTLGRARDAQDSLAEASLHKLLRSLPRRRRPAGFPVRELILFRSQLLPGGPLYTALSAHRLAPPTRGGTLAEPHQGTERLIGEAAQPDG
jgi:2'-5' RNA ligase